DVVRTTPHAQAVRAQLAVIEELTARGLLGFPDVEADVFARSGLAPRRADLLARVRQPGGTRPDRNVELRRARGTLLRDDVDDTRRRFRSIQRRGRRSLDDLDALDLVRREVVQLRHLATVTHVRTGRALVVHADAVH